MTKSYVVAWRDPWAAVACSIPVMVNLVVNNTARSDDLDRAGCVAVGVGISVSIPVRVGSAPVDRVVTCRAILNRRVRDVDPIDLNESRDGLPVHVCHGAGRGECPLVGDPPGA